LKINDKYHFQKQWEEYRRRRNRQYIAAVACGVMPNLIFFSLLKSGAESSTAAVVLVFSSIVSVIVILAVMFHFHKWICPNCEKRFFVKSYWVRFPELLPNCTNCNLPKYAGSTFEKN